MCVTVLHVQRLVSYMQISCSNYCDWRIKRLSYMSCTCPVHVRILITYLLSLQAQGLCEFREYLPAEIYSVRFICGICLFLFGFGTNLQADHILRNLRQPGEDGYKIPRGGAFELVSGAHHWGEIVEWTGYAIAVNSLFGWAFAIYTASNLIPRAISHHQWYQDTFKDYPKNRKAVIPFLW